MTGSMVLSGKDPGFGVTMPGWLPLPVRQRLSSSHGFLLWREGADNSRAAVALLKMDWDCNHFDSLIGEVIIIPSGKYGEELVADILPEMLALAYSDGWQHASVHVDAGNALLADIVRRAGFWLADTKMIYRRSPDLSTSSPRLLFSPREMVNRDIDKVRRIISRAEFPSRFSRDGFFEADRVTGMHLSWFENIIRRPESERVACVAESEGNIMAFAVAESVSRKEQRGVWQGYSRALAAGERSACGAALAAVGAMTFIAQRRQSPIECVVSAHNPAAIRGLRYLGYQLFGSQLAFHRIITRQSRCSRLCVSSGSL